MTVAAVALALAAAVANAFAVVLQALEDRQAPTSDSGRLALLVGLAHRPRWLAGTALMVLAWPVQVLALSLATISVVQPLLVADQLVLLALARARLDERVGQAEALGALAIVFGAVTVVVVSPHHAAHRAGAPATVPLLAVGLAGLLMYALARLRAGAPLLLLVGAGLAYAWVDFASQLVAGTVSAHQWVYAALWLAAVIGIGGLAFLQETTALQHRPAVTVEPVIAAVHQPLPVLMAFWAGIEAWGHGTARLAILIAGLAVLTAGATLLGRSPSTDTWRARPAPPPVASPT